MYPPSAWYLQGYALNLTDSIARLRYRNGREGGELVKPGEPVQVTLTLYPTSNLFMPGAPDPPGRVELELPAIRRETEHGRGDRAGAAAGGGGRHRVPRAGRESRVVVPVVPIERS